MLRIRSAGDKDPSMLRRMISSFCYAMDLVLQSPEENAVNVLGVSSNPEAWANRIREAAASFHQSVGQQSTELEIKIEGPWMRDGDKTQLEAALLEALGATCSHA
jgi:hypothetical protein